MNGGSLGSRFSGGWAHARVDECRIASRYASLPLPFVFGSCGCISIRENGHICPTPVNKSRKGAEDPPSSTVLSRRRSRRADLSWNPPEGTRRLLSTRSSIPRIRIGSRTCPHLEPKPAYMMHCWSTFMKNEVTGRNARGTHNAVTMSDSWFWEDLMTYANGERISSGPRHTCVVHQPTRSSTCERARTA